MDSNIKMITNIHDGIYEPTGTAPIITSTPAVNNSDASKFLILKALQEAEATKKANNANIVASNGLNNESNIQVNSELGS